MKKTWMVLALASACIAGAQAGEIYTGIGTHGVMVGYAQPLSSSITVRGDFATIGSHDSQENEDGIDYDATLKYKRTGLFADWFFAGGWRLTGGVTANNMRLDLSGRTNGSDIEIGDDTYTTQAGDRFDVQVKFPSTTPYLGIGYGHQQSESGFGFHFDIGASIGKAKVTAAFSGPTYNSMSQPERDELNADIARETQELRDGVGKIKAIPQLSLGINYRF